jgi:hypothetical protein
VGTVPRTAAGDTSSELTPEEQSILLRAGWQPGDAIPDLTNTALGRRMAAEAKHIETASNDLTNVPVNIDPTLAPKTMPTPTQITDLPLDQQEAALLKFQEMEEVRQAIEGVRARTPVNASVRLTAQREASPKTVQTPEASTIGFVNDLDVELEDKKQLERDLKTLKRVPDDAEKRCCQKTRETCSQEQKEEPETDSSDSVSDKDKLMYLACIMGEQPRFTREVSLFDGRIRIVFRTLRPAETDQILEQVDFDMAEKRIRNQYHYMRKVNTYRMLASIDRIARDNQPWTVLGDAVNLKTDRTPNTVLIARETMLNRDWFTSDSLRSVVQQQFTQFEKTVKEIERQATNPDFFKGIE